MSALSSLHPNEIERPRDKEFPFSVEWSDAPGKDIAVAEARFERLNDAEAWFDELQKDGTQKDEGRSIWLTELVEIDKSALEGLDTTEINRLRCNEITSEGMRVWVYKKVSGTKRIREDYRVGALCHSTQYTPKHTSFDKRAS